MNEINRLVFPTLMRCILEIEIFWNMKNGLQIVLNLKIYDHCREQICLDKHFPTFWASWAETLIFQIVWFWNKTWLHTIILWCSWKIQVFWKLSKWYAFLKNLNKLVIWYMSRFAISKIPFRPLTMITQDYLFHSRLTSRDTLPKSQIFHCPMSVQSDLYFFP